jgi:hypothetical protein
VDTNAERPQHELIASPWLTNGQIAAIKTILDSWLEADALLTLDDDDLDEIGEQVARGVRFDPAQVRGIRTNHQLFVARTAYWAIQALQALDKHLWPDIAGDVSGAGGHWVDENAQRIDTMPKEEP